MGSICLSSASILRCVSLTRNQNIYLVIPTMVEVILSTLLVFIDWGPGKRNLLLTAEGVSFLILVVLDLASNTLPAVRGNLHLFNAFDLAIGIASLVPISLYTIFLYLLIITEVVNALPRRIKYFTMLAPVLFIFAILVSSGITAFTSSSIRDTLATKAPKNILSPRSTGQEAWTISTTLTLVLLASFQAAIFSFALFRLTQTILLQRGNGSQSSGRAHPVKGIGWISGSLVLGITETTLGFAVGGFGMVLTRRILRLLARASLCIGVAKGLPTGTRFREPRFHKLISNPRFSTFHHLSPTARSFHAAQQTPDIKEKCAIYNPPITTIEPPDMAHTRAPNGRQRVSVRYRQGRPLLHLRLSMLEMPSLESMVKEIESPSPRPATIIEGLKSRPPSELSSLRSDPYQPSHSALRYSTDSIPSFCAPVELVSTPRRTLSQRSARAQLYQAVLPATSSPSTEPVNNRHDSLQAVQDLAGQFPGPPMTFTDGNTFIMPSPIFQVLGSPSQLRSNKQFPLPDGGEWSSNLSSPIASSDNRSFQSSRRPTLYNVKGTPLRSAHLFPLDPFNDSDDDGSAPLSRTPLRSASLYPLDPFNEDDEVDTFWTFRTPIIDKKMSDSTMPGSGPASNIQDPEAGTRDLATTLKTGKSPQSKPRKLRSSRSKSRDVSHSGDARESTTPLPIHANPKRGNLKHIIIPPRHSNMPQILNENGQSGVNSNLGEEVLSEDIDGQGRIYS